MEKHNGKRRYYFGIDLGTTNSVVAYADTKQQVGSFIEPEVVKIRMPDAMNPDAEVVEDHLPSCVDFGSDPPQKIVGKYAKQTLLANPDFVEKSIKTQMGSTSYRPFGYTPEKISSILLKALYNGIPKYGFPKEEFLEEVVIGVPACFGKKQSAATLEAAKLAGFRKTILIDEPTAAIYDYRNQQNRRLFPNLAVGIDFEVDKPKLILVFDLGGGTLDVTLHQVSLDKTQKLSVNDITVSRKPNIAGNYFDLLLSKHFLKIRKDRFPAAPTPTIKRQYQEYAEQAKIELSEDVYAHISARTFNPARYELKFSSKGRDRTLDGVCDSPAYNLTLCRYEEIIAPVLANHLTLSDVATFCPPKAFKNIIDPILDVLQKGQSELNSKEPITPDAVLLNGAMTKLYTIKKRLETFFPGVPISPILNPEKAVARGAVIAHYNEYNP